MHKCASRRRRLFRNGVCGFREHGACRGPLREDDILGLNVYECGARRGKYSVAGSALRPCCACPALTLPA